jgi:adenylate kinase family enzyme
VTLERIVIVGDSCSGKTTLARALATGLGHPHLELDAFHWAPSWTPRPKDAFHRDVECAITGPRWIVDGNYHRLIERMWGRATDLIWLDYPLPLVLGRWARRTFHRLRTGERLWAGNRETLQRTLLTHDSLLLWILTSRRRRRQEYGEILQQRRFPQLKTHVFRSPRTMEEWLRSVVPRSS